MRRLVDPTGVNWIVDLVIKNCNKFYMHYCEVRVSYASEASSSLQQPAGPLNLWVLLVCSVAGQVQPPLSVL